MMNDPTSDISTLVALARPADYNLNDPYDTGAFIPQPTLKKIPLALVS